MNQNDFYEMNQNDFCELTTPAKVVREYTQVIWRAFDARSESKL